MGYDRLFMQLVKPHKRYSHILHLFHVYENHKDEILHVLVLSLIVFHGLAANQLKGGKKSA